MCKGERTNGKLRYLIGKLKYIIRKLWVPNKRIEVSINKCMVFSKHKSVYMVINISVATKWLLDAKKRSDGQLFNSRKTK